MADIFVATGMFQGRAGAVHRQKGHPVGGQVVKGMGICVTQDKIETMVVATSECVLEAVIPGAVDVRQIVDDIEIWELRSEGLSSRRQCTWSGLIDVNHARKFHSMITDVSGFKRQLGGKSVLDAQGPVFNVRSPEIAIHGEGVARAWVGSGAVPALNQISNAGGIDSGGLVLPSYGG